jgi:NTP pyrophosphatase (non-canonical NTP hydrolase)
MDSNEYISWCEKTLHDPGNFIKRELLHGAIGIITEAGELADLIKKMMFTNKVISRDMIIDEVGDGLYYYATILRSIGGTFEEAMNKNVAKLTVRYEKNKGEKDRKAEAEAQSLV